MGILFLSAYILQYIQSLLYLNKMYFLVICSAYRRNLNHMYSTISHHILIDCVQFQMKYDCMLHIMYIYMHCTFVCPFNFCMLLAYRFEANFHQQRFSVSKFMYYQTVNVLTISQWGTANAEIKGRFRWQPRTDKCSAFKARFAQCQKFHP